MTERDAPKLLIRSKLFSFVEEEEFYQMPAQNRTVVRFVVFWQYPPASLKTYETFKTRVFIVTFSSLISTSDRALSYNINVKLNATEVLDTKTQHNETLTANCMVVCNS